MLQLARDVVLLVLVKALARALAVNAVKRPATGVPMEVGPQRGGGQEDFDTRVLMASESLIGVVDLEKNDWVSRGIDALPGVCISDGRKSGFQ